MEEKSDLILDVNEKPSIGKWIILAIQHVFAMFGATILVPILVNAGAGEEVLTIPVALVSSGIGTLIYILCTKGKSPVYLGSSFAFIAPLIAAYLKGGISGAMTGIMVVGLIYVLFAIIIKLIGKNWINKLLPPVVIGPMIMIIGLRTCTICNRTNWTCIRCDFRMATNSSCVSGIFSHCNCCSCSKRFFKSNTFFDRNSSRIFDWYSSWYS